MTKQRVVQPVSLKIRFSLGWRVVRSWGANRHDRQIKCSDVDMFVIAVQTATFEDKNQLFAKLANLNEGSGN